MIGLVRRAERVAHKQWIGGQPAGDPVLTVVAWRG
jgi:hypothetical protein